MYSIWTTFPISLFPTCFRNKNLQIYETYNLCSKRRYTGQTFSYWKRKRERKQNFVQRKKNRPTWLNWMESPAVFCESRCVFSRVCELDLDPTQASEAPWARGISRSRRVREKRIGDELGDVRRIEAIRSTDIGNRPDSTKVPRRPKSRLRFV